MTAGSVLDLAWLVPAFPLAGAVVLGLGRRRLGEPAAGWLASLMAAAAFAWSVAVFAALASLPADGRRHFVRLFEWIAAGGLRVEAELLVDPLSVTMILFVTGVGTLIHVYSIGYMHGDARFTRFFAFLNLFMFSMLVLVLAGDFLFLFVGWEAVGLCSYLLISFWFERPAAAAAGKKAFVTNRVGDFGFLLALFLIFARLGTLSFAHVLPAAGGLASGTATAIALLLFLGAAGKSAQGPLFVWLPDAMEGPTPVSALIHAATMVTAGVYLVARAWPFFARSGVAGDVVAWVGVATALVAATIALVHDDIKRVLAYSTISQLGYMFLAAGLGAYSAAMFHMVTNAFFKALLFLGAGSVMHGLGGETDMRRMGGLRHLMPVTAATFVVAWLAIAGIVPLAGFWSKDEILAAAFADGRYGLWAVGAVTAVLTGLYMSRQVLLVFYGNPRWRRAGGTEPRESPAVMTVPLVVLAGLTVAGGLLNLPFGSLRFLTRWLEPVFAGVPELGPGSFTEGFVLATAALAAAVVGVALAVALYRRGLAGPDPLPARLGPLARLFAGGWYLDRLYRLAVDRPGRRLADWLASPFDQGIIDGAVNGLARTVRAAGAAGRRLQTGYVRSYALVFLAGTTAAVLVVVARAAL